VRKKRYPPTLKRKYHRWRRKKSKDTAQRWFPALRDKREKGEGNPDWGSGLKFTGWGILLNRTEGYPDFGEEPG